VLVCLAWLIKIRMPVVAQLLPCNSALLLLPTALLSLPVGLPFILLPLTGMVMAKLTLTDESSGFQTTTQRNANYTAIETALENTLSRDGTSPNAMGANLDMNSYRIINLPAPIANSDAARWVDVASAVGLSTAVPNQTGNGGRVLSTDGTSLTWKNAPVAVDTVADMKALTGLVNGAYVYCGGYYAKGDAGAGTFYYNSASAATADNGKYITPNTMAGRFVRIITDMFTPQMFGAKADGSTNDTVAIQAACDACNPGFANSGSTGQFSVNYVFFPAGVYRTTAAVTIYGGHTLTGERAAFKPDAGVTVFSVTGTYQNRFDNLIFNGGAWCIVFDTGNVDTSTITIENCEFQDQTAGHIQTSALSASTLFRIKHCKFYNNSSSSAFIGVDLMGGSLHLTACWVTTAQTFIRNGDSLTGQGGTVILDDLFGVPRYAGNGGAVFVNNSCNLVMRDCRFGGESDNILVICNPPVTATGTYVIIDGCAVFPGDQPIVSFNYMPNQFQFINNLGVSNSWEKGFLFNAGSATTFGTIRGSTNTFIVRDNSETSAPNYQGSQEGQSKTHALNNEKIAPSNTIFTADKVAQYITNGGAGWGGSNSNITVTTPTTNGFGAAVRAITGSSASYNGSFSDTYTTGLAGLASGMYTVVVNVEITTQHITSVTLYAGANDKGFKLGKGRHVLCLPTYYVAGTDAQLAGFGCDNMSSAQVAVFGPVRVYTGLVEVKTENNIVYGTAAPSTLRWELGDRVLNSAPTVGQPKSWVCSTAGVPGTWTSEGNL